MVIIFSSQTTAKTPTFHRWADEYHHEKHPMPLTEGAEERVTMFTTACGRLLNEHRWIERFDGKPLTLVDRQVPWVGMRSDNTELIGKPCHACWPTADGRPSDG